MCFGLHTFAVLLWLLPTLLQFVLLRLLDSLWFVCSFVLLYMVCLYLDVTVVCSLLLLKLLLWLLLRSITLDLLLFPFTCFSCLLLLIVLVMLTLLQQLSICSLGRKMMFGLSSTR